MRTQSEIVTEIRRLNQPNSFEDFMAIKRIDMLVFLEFENAFEFLKPETKKEEWPPVMPLTKETVLLEMTKYMSFAWGKANNCRGISAGISIDHFDTWIWLLNDEAFKNKIDAIEYQHYGKEKLIAICEHIGFDWKKFDDGVRTNGE